MVLFMTSSHSVYKKQREGFPGGSAVMNPPAHAGDMSSIPDLGQSHIPWNNLDRAPQLSSLCSRTWEPQLLKPACPEGHAPQQKSAQWEARAAQERAPPPAPPRPHPAPPPAPPLRNRRRACAATQTPHSQNKYIQFLNGTFLGLVNSISKFDKMPNIIRGKKLMMSI